MYLNTSNIVFLKSTDDSMLETLQKMSGTTHKSYIDQKTVTRDMEKLIMANEGKASYMMQTKEVPVISYNDMAFIAERNSIVFRAGDAPIWNKNETILPMSWRLFKDTIEQPGQKFTLQTIPTLSSAIDFDLKKNQPDFDELLRIRMNQAALSAPAAEAYKTAFQYDDDDIHRLDIDVYAADVMDMVSAQMERDEAKSEDGDDDSFMDSFDESMFMEPVVDDDVVAEVESRMSAKKVADTKIYAHNQVAKSDLVNATGMATHMFDAQISDIYKELKGDFMRDPQFRFANECLCSLDGSQVFIRQVSMADAEAIRAAASDPESNVYSDQEISDEDLADFVSYEITDDFYRYLASLNSWMAIAKGKFDEAMTRRLSGE